ncbi:hypothetical protein SAMN05518672_101865 [Chitinophaga sp. CF118]|uniref:hypothetical protein n=1 Tax=Chitinophaga sp. CF118 TaxID=1884367 RepID=UPI0008E31984|nr:hypothetical protein [Chitinophaga sp. CF118]SFD17220.1 hypothetical protein SAMN05518672_101865 [Chitinophaga sp. CF118]
MKYLIACLLFSLSLTITCFAQDDLKKKNVSDTILKQDRTLEMPNPFDATKALLKLFPGKYYNLSKDKYINDLISWECKTCATKQYTDVNEDGNSPFPFSDGVATRLINIMSYKDSSGTQYKVISFNHSAYDPDGAQTSRFTGGLLGLAKFVLSDSTWKLKFFQPAIAAYGAFSQCPRPVAVLIGKDQYAFMIKSINGAAGGPFDGAFFLIAGANGAYQQVMGAYGIERTEAGDEWSSWTSEYSVPVSEKKFFRDIIITTKGTYTSEDTENMPEELKALIKGKKKGKFMMVQQYVYKGSKGYVPQPVKASLLD